MWRGFGWKISASIRQGRWFYKPNDKAKHVQWKSWMKRADFSTVQPDKHSAMHPYLTQAEISLHEKKKGLYIETYGCQMNVNDTEIVLSIMREAGYEKRDSFHEADVIFLMTCAIRENAENKIWKRLELFHQLKLKQRHLKIGVLGCMAERLKMKLVEKEKAIDVVCGPDAYRDLPRLVQVTENGQVGVNVMLSLEETYADITPVRLNEGGVSAFVSIMRGCNNMCSYCIVPFTRGRERSRSIESILDEVKLFRDQGVKEITLLGQNVNSYEYLLPADSQPSWLADNIERLRRISTSLTMSRDFQTIYSKKKYEGQDHIMRFANLLDQVSLVDPEMRIRFTSPHPKDFPDDLLYLIRDRPNICKSLHLPAQSGSTFVLDRMRRGYTREAYLRLVKRVREIIPDITISSDFISGFSGETIDDHHMTLDLLRQVGYDMAFMFAYSMREKTHAHRNYIDDVPESVKQQRLQEVISTFQEIVRHKNSLLESTYQLVLVEGKSKRSAEEWSGRTDGNHTAIFPDLAVPYFHPLNPSEAISYKKVEPGDYVLVRIESSTSLTLRGIPLARTTLVHYHQWKERLHDSMQTISTAGLA